MQTQTAQTVDHRHGILATHCCICRRELADAKSVQQGIGPQCAKQYAQATIKPTPVMLMRALGLLQVAGLPADVTDEILRHKNDAHKVCNLLVMHSSRNYDQKAVVLACTPIIRALGWTDLADKLETDRTRLSARADTGDFIKVCTPFNPSCQRTLNRVRGARWIAAKTRGGHHLIPKNGWDHAVCVLGIYYGGEEMATDQGVSKLDRRMWSDLLPFTQPAPSARPGVPAAPAAFQAPVAAEVRIERMGTTLRVFTPYNVGFVSEVRNIRGRRWNAMDKCWELPAAAHQTAIDMIQTHYGVRL